MTGSFTQAEEPANPAKVQVDNIRWEFDNGKVVEGHIARQNFSEGLHNVTVYINKSNGEEVHRAQIEVTR